MHIAVFLRSHAGIVFEELYEMTLGRERQVICDLNQAVIAELQEILCLFNLFFPDIITDGYSCFFFKNTG